MKTSKSAVKRVASKKTAVKSAKKTVRKPATPARKKAVKKAAKKIAKKAVKKAGEKKAAKKIVAKKSPAKKVSRKKAMPAAVKKIPAAAAPTPTPRRPKVFTPRHESHGFGFPAETPEIPELYGEDQVVLMTKDPEYLFAYWEITPAKMAHAEKNKQKGEEYREAMRLNWAARDLFEKNFTVLPVSLAARKWYLRVPFSGLSYQIELGWLSEHGHFISLMTSNPSDAPESWAATRRRLKKSAAADSLLARTLNAGMPQGSSDSVRGERLSPRGLEFEAPIRCPRPSARNRAADPRGSRKLRRWPTSTSSCTRTFPSCATPSTPASWRKSGSTRP